MVFACGAGGAGAVSDGPSHCVANALHGKVLCSDSDAFLGLWMRCGALFCDVSGIGRYQSAALVLNRLS
jgi:hypothetical protein